MSCADGGNGEDRRRRGPPGFEDFYRTEFPSLVRALFLLVPDADEAQELAQEAMVRVYERWDRVSGMASPGGYLYRVATNLNRRRIRSLAVRTRRLRTLGAGLPDVEIDPGRRDLADAISSLSVRLREAFKLVDSRVVREPQGAGRPQRRSSRNRASCRIMTPCGWA